MRVTYSSNNSGGGWWLTDDDWKKLEDAGWFVNWGGLYFCHSNWRPAPEGKPQPHSSSGECPGHRMYERWEDVGENRWIGALAKKATIEVESVADAINSFEEVTNQDTSDEGCNCCGPPHSFEWRGGWCSGEDTLGYLYPDKDSSKSKRKLLEES